jgi:hypothetical protein
LDEPTTTYRPFESRGRVPFAIEFWTTAARSLSDRLAPREYGSTVFRAHRMDPV